MRRLKLPNRDRVRAPELAILAIVIWIVLMIVSDLAKAQGVACPSPRELGWTVAAGPVAKYEVQVSTDGTTWAPLREVTVLKAPVDGPAGATVRVRVRAKDAAGVVGPWSLESDPLVVCPGAPGKPIWAATPTALILEEPTVAWTGRPLGPGHPLYACAWWTPCYPGSDPWLRPTSSSGGGLQEIPWPSVVGARCEYSAACISPDGWTAPAVLEVVLTAR